MRSEDWWRKKSALLRVIVWICFAQGYFAKDELKSTAVDNIVYGAYSKDVSFRFKFVREDGSSPSIQIPKEIVFSVFNRTSQKAKFVWSLEVSSDGSTARKVYKLDSALAVEPDAGAEIFKDRTDVIYHSSADYEFVLKRVQAEDMKFGYEVEVTINSFTRFQALVFLAEAVKPTIAQSSIFPEYTVVVGSQLAMTCTAAGKPDPQVRWVQKLNGMRKIQVSGVNEARFVLNDVTREAAAEYECEAENDAGLVSRSTAVMIAYIELENSGFVSLSLPVDKQLVVECKIAGHPTPDYAWYNPKGSVIDSVRKLEYGRLNENDFGNYTCSAANLAGKQTYRVEVKRIYEPVIDNKPSIGSGNGAGTLQKACCLVAYLFLVCCVLLV